MPVPQGDGTAGVSPFLVPAVAAARASGAAQAAVAVGVGGGAPCAFSVGRSFAVRGVGDVKVEGSASCFFERCGESFVPPARKRRRCDRTLAFELGEDAPSVAPRGDWGPSAHVLAQRARTLHLRVRAEMQLIGARLVTEQRAIDAVLPDRAWVEDCVKEFFLPSELESGRGPSVCDAFISRARASLLPLFRAPGTWRKYLGPWRRARAFMRAAVEADGHVWCVETLQDTRYTQACAVWAFETTTTPSAVDTMVLAIRMALRVNGIELGERSFITKMVTSVARRQRKLPVKKKNGISWKEVSEILEGYGGDSCPTWSIMIAVWVGIGFLSLLRYSDARLIRLDGVYWLEKGVSIFLPRRKNMQEGEGSWLPVADTGGAFSAVAVLRRLFARLGHVVPVGHVGVFGTAKVFLLRDL